MRPTFERFKYTTAEQWAGVLSSLRTVTGDPFALMLLWNWFIHPLGAPWLGFGGAFGLRLVWGLTGLWRQSPWNGWLYRRSLREDATLAASGGALGFALVQWLSLAILVGFGFLAYAASHVRFS